MSDQLSDWKPTDGRPRSGPAAAAACICTNGQTDAQTDGQTDRDPFFSLLASDPLVSVRSLLEQHRCVCVHMLMLAAFPPSLFLSPLSFGRSASWEAGIEAGGHTHRRAALLAERAVLLVACW